MTENEAIEVLSNELIVITDMIGYCRDFEKESDLALAYRVKRQEAHKIAISALKEIQQYREIGTVKECREMASIISKAERNELAKIIDDWLLYKKIGTVEECRVAVEKQKAMKVKEVHVDEYYCPACGSENCCDQGIVGDRYCPYCGHAIDENLEEMEDDTSAKN